MTQPNTPTDKPITRSEQLKKDELWKKFKLDFRNEMRKKHPPKEIKPVKPTKL